MPSQPEISAARQKLKRLSKRLEQQTGCSIEIRVAKRKAPAEETDKNDELSELPEKRRRTMSWMVRAGARRVHRRVANVDRARQRDLIAAQAQTIAEEHLTVRDARKRWKPFALRQVKRLQQQIKEEWGFDSDLRGAYINLGKCLGYLLQGARECCDAHHGAVIMVWLDNTGFKPPRRRRGVAKESFDGKVQSGAMDLRLCNNGTGSLQHNIRVCRWLGKENAEVLQQIINRTGATSFLSNTQQFEQLLGFSIDFIYSMDLKTLCVVLGLNVDECLFC